MQFFSFKTVKNQRGAVAIIVGICLFLFMGFAAMAIDIGNLFVARNELQNAADAGALAGARNLYLEDGTRVNKNANQIAYDAAIANESQKEKVEVNWEFDTNTGDIERGHYSFLANNGDGEFVANDSLYAVDLDRSDHDLDAYNPDEPFPFINAVRVVTRRKANPVTTFFAGIIGFSEVSVSAEAIAYIGFAGSLRPGDIDLPIGLCDRSITTSDEVYSCNIGRMLDANATTGGWSDLDHDSTGASDHKTIREMINSDDGNQKPIILGEEVGTTGGVQNWNEIYNRWLEKSNQGTQIWDVTLAVIHCPKKNVSPRSIIEGVVTVSIVWVTGLGEDKSYSEAPTVMSNWSNSDPDGKVRWEDFVENFDLVNSTDENDPAVYQQKTIYFLPSCEPQAPRGATGGNNFGILAEIPVLVR